MRIVEIVGYLTQHKLAEAVKQITGEAWAGTELSLPGYRHRWDMAFRIDSLMTLVEYDGDDNYCKTLRIKADREKDKIAHEFGYNIIRFPYWVQLDTITLSHFFGLEANVKQDFPHGFITTKVFPASFCEMGVARFQRELSELPPVIRQAVIKSLRDRASEHGMEYVLPSSLLHIVEG